MDILHKLDKIIMLLKEIRDRPIVSFDNEQATGFFPKAQYNHVGYKIIHDFTIDPDLIKDDIYAQPNTDPLCNCHLHKPGESTAGWYCPAHGQRF